MACIDVINGFKKAEQSGIFEVDKIYDRQTITDFISDLNAGIQNPTALTFNRINCGQPFWCPHFVWLGAGKYEYKGHLGNYTGDVFHYQHNLSSPRLVGYYDKGFIEFEDEDIQDFSDYKSKYCKNNGDNNEPPNDENILDTPVNVEKDNCPNLDYFPSDRNLKIVEKYDFKKIGEYTKENGDNLVNTHSLVNNSLRFKLVYALISEGEVKYIGKTIQGYKRPLNYLNNNVMHRVQNGIKYQLENGHNVDIYIRCHDFDLLENLENKLPIMNVFSAFEEAIIKEFKPSWNSQV